MSDPFQLIVGLGNPGPEYSATRHNAGFWCIDRLASDFHCNFRNDGKFFGEVARLSRSGLDCWLLKPGTWMNHSGRSVQALLSFYKLDIERMLVIHDEIDLPPGTIRLKTGGGHGGHNGLRDIISHLGSRDFWRLRIGVGHPGHRDQVVAAVLSKPTPGERKLIDGVIARALQVMPLIFNGEFERAMNELHTGARPPATSDDD